MSPEQRYRLEQAKDNTPGTSLFIWFIPCFLILAWMCRNDLPIELSGQSSDVHYVKQQASDSNYYKDDMHLDHSGVDVLGWLGKHFVKLI